MEHAQQIQALLTEAGLEAIDAATGSRPRTNDDGELWFVQTFGSAIASTPS
jgi:hypothetical protein